MRTLESLGVRTALESFAGRPQEIHLYHGTSGRVLQRLPLGDWISERHGAPYLVAHRRDLQRVLLDAVLGQSLIEISRGFAVARFVADASGARVFDDDGQAIEGAALIGADGLFSSIRRQLHPMRGLRYSGRTAARAVVATEAVAAHLDVTVTGVWLAPDSHVVHYPVRGGREIAVVVISDETWDDGQSADKSWSDPVDRSFIREKLAIFAPRLQSALTECQDWGRWRLFDATPLPRWSAGPVTLIGDAAHPTLPFLAQGGCLALEDAVVLAGLIEQGQADLATAFQEFERLRRPRAKAVAKAARRNGQIYHLGPATAVFRDLALRVLPADRLMASYDWIYGWRP